MDVTQLAGYRRQAALVIVSRDVTVPEMSEVLGVPPDQALELGGIRSGARIPVPAKENSWEVLELADSSVDMSEVIGDLARRVIPLRPGLVVLRNRGCVIKLDLVQWISPIDPVGPGFSLSMEMITFLADVGCTVDVDQYVESEPGSTQ